MQLPPSEKPRSRSHVSLETTVRLPRVVAPKPSTPPSPLAALARSGYARTLLLTTIISFVAIVSRRPDALFNPQFWAEDGVIWYAQAYSLGGGHALLMPYAGYFQTYSRLVAWFAVHLPLVWGPLVFNLAGIAAGMLPALILASHRFDKLLPDWRLRIGIIALYLAVPNSGEIDATLTNAQWHLALAMLLIVIGSAPTSRWARWFDYALFVVGGLTGPFCLFMAPLIAIAWWMNRRPSWLLRLGIIDITAAVIQIISLLYLSPHERSLQLGMDAPLLARLIGGQIGLGLTVGSWGYVLVAPHHFWQAGLAPWVVTIAVIVVFAVALLKAPWQLRLVIVFVAMQLGGALFLGAGPQGIEAAWGALATPTFGARYYVAPILALGCCLIWLATQARWKAAQWLALSALLLTLLVGIPHDWGYTPYQDNHWRYYAAQFDALPPGAQIAIPINPGWQLHLIKQ